MDDQAIKNYFHFDETDLNANRNGRLSEKQTKAIIDDNKSSQKFGIGCGLISGIGLLALASIFPIVFIPMGISSWQGHDVGGAIGSWIGAAVWALSWGGIGIFSIYFGISSATKDNSKIILKSVTGPINLVGVERHSGGEHPHTYIEHELHIGQEEFKVDESLAGYMMQGDIFSIYYMTYQDGTGKKILSVEWHSKG